MSKIDTQGLGTCLEDLKKLSEAKELGSERYDFHLTSGGLYQLEINGELTDYYIDEQGYLRLAEHIEVNILQWIQLHKKPKEEDLKIAKKYGVAVYADNFNSNKLASYLLKKHKLIFNNEDFYVYRNGVYKLLSPHFINRFVKHTISKECTKFRCEETLHALKTACYVPKLNKTSLLNLKNGMFDITRGELLPRDPNNYSTIQHDFEYDPNATCLLWEKTLNEIFDNGLERISLLEEYIGSCLIKETKYAKALFCVGEGANGKSVILHVIQKLLDEANCSTVPLDKLGDLGYCSQLENKLANISDETEAKLKLSDSTFKAIVSGDPITINPKYKPQITIYPHCKLIFATNNMFYASDHTDALFRRVIILPFRHKFEENIANRDLKYQLEKELPGIFLWALAGLQRLRARGYFEIPASIQLEIDEFRKDNAPILQFAEERLHLRAGAGVPIKTVYDEYVTWCKEDNHHQVNKRLFINELLKHFKGKVERDKVLSQRGLRGLDLLPRDSYLEDEDFVDSSVLKVQEGA